MAKPKKAKKKKKAKKESDPLAAIKYRGYCRAHSPPGEDMSLVDFVNFAKFYMCRHAHRLWKDPIWETYTDEEILIEYFAHLFTVDKEARTAYEAKAFSGEDIHGEDVYDWLDRMVALNQKEMAEKLDTLPDKVSFSPDSNKDIEE